ncbi:unnamed protein product, partial [Callosobruchus maculatus]
FFRLLSHEDTVSQIRVFEIQNLYAFCRRRLDGTTYSNQYRDTLAILYASPEPSEQLHLNVWIIYMSNT